VTLRSNNYYYYPTTLTETSSDVNAKVGIASTSQEYKMLFTNSSTGADTANAQKICIAGSDRRLSVCSLAMFTLGCTLSNWVELTATTYTIRTTQRPHLSMVCVP